MGSPVDVGLMVQSSGLGAKALGLCGFGHEDFGWVRVLGFRI